MSHLEYTFTLPADTEAGRSFDTIMSLKDVYAFAKESGANNKLISTSVLPVEVRAYKFEGDQEHFEVFNFQSGFAGGAVCVGVDKGDLLSHKETVKNAIGLGSFFAALQSGMQFSKASKSVIEYAELKSSCVPA